MRKRAIKKLLLILPVILILFFSGLKISEKILVGKVASMSSGNLKIGAVAFRVPSFVIHSIDISTPFINMFFKEISVRPVFARRALAFSGPGELILQQKSRDISLKGSVSGSFKDKTVNIEETHIEIDRVGGVAIRGLLEDWGRSAVNAFVEFKGIEVEELKKIFDVNLPFGGKVFGEAQFVSDEKKRDLKFDVEIRDIVSEREGYLNAFVRGSYNISDSYGKIYEGTLLGSDGGKIIFSGEMDKESFKLDFHAEKMSIEDLLRLIPENVRERYNLSVKGGSLELDDFKLARLKKKSFLTD